MVDARLGSEFRDARGRASGDRTFRLIGTCWNKDLPDSVGGANPETPPLWPDGITPEMLGPPKCFRSEKHVRAPGLWHWPERLSFRG